MDILNFSSSFHKTGKELPLFQGKTFEVSLDAICNSEGGGGGAFETFLCLCLSLSWQGNFFFWLKLAKILLTHVLELTAIILGMCHVYKQSLSWACQWLHASLMISHLRRKKQYRKEKEGCWHALCRFPLACHEGRSLQTLFSVLTYSSKQVLMFC